MDKQTCIILSEENYTMYVNANCNPNHSRLPGSQPPWQHP